MAFKAFCCSPKQSDNETNYNANTLFYTRSLAIYLQQVGSFSLLMTIQFFSTEQLSDSWARLRKGLYGQSFWWATLKSLFIFLAKLILLVLVLIAM